MEPREELIMWWTGEGRKDWAKDMRENTKGQERRKGEEKNVSVWRKEWILSDKMLKLII